jgi:uncharacterized protein YqeY
MSLQEKIDQDIKEAMLAKDSVRLRGLRAIKSAVLLAKTEKGNAELTEDIEIRLLQRLVKQRKESVDIYQEQNRPDLLAIEKEELEVIEKYLPAQLNREEIESKIKEILSQNGLTGMKDMGKAMGLVNAALAGKADGKTISGIVKSLLAH